MSDMSSSYTIDLIVKDDETKDAIRKLKDEVRKIGDNVSLGDFHEQNKQIQYAIGMIDKLANRTDINFKSISREFGNESSKLIKGLETQFIELSSSLENAEEKAKVLEKTKRAIEAELKKTNDGERQRELNIELASVQSKISDLKIKETKQMIEQNRQVRYQLKVASMMSQKEILLKKIKDAQSKSSLKFWTTENKANSEQIKMLREKIKLLENEEKQERKIGQAVKAVAKEQENATKKQNGKLQNIYNAAGLVGGVGRTVKAVGSGAFGLLGSGINAASSAANSNLDKEREARRVKGMSGKDASDLLGKLYIKTGADYSTIVDAINKVRTTLKWTSEGELITAVEAELRHPGIADAFASSTTEFNEKNINIYVNRMRSIQKTTGATDEQINEAAKLFANMKPSDIGNAKITELQAIYHGVQNSGAFDSKEEIDKAFERFLSFQKEEGGDVVSNASNFDWTSVITNERNRLQAENTIKNMDWSGIIGSATFRDDEKIEKTHSESLSEQMRELEMKKNDLIIKVLVPVANELLKVIDSPEGKKIIDGLVNFFTKAIPLLTDIIKWIKEKIEAGINGMENVFLAIDKQNEEQTRRQIDAASKGSTAGMIAYRGGADHFMANGGIAIGPSIVGERAFQPEMILPLDYSRSSRAGNIIQNVAQTFNMSGSETTALSLAQAVKSRDFRRATSQNAFLSARVGSW